MMTTMMVMMAFCCIPMRSVYLSERHKCPARKLRSKLDPADGIDPYLFIAFFWADTAASGLIQPLFFWVTEPLLAWKV